MSNDDLAACLRMRASLAGIIDLDPEGVTARLAEMDEQIARLRTHLGIEEKRPAAGRLPIEVIPIGARVRAA